MATAGGPTTGLPQADRLSIPGKVFLLGEYSVLGGRPALVATMGPRFEMRAVSALGAALEPGEVLVSDAHPASPTGRLVRWARERGIRELALAFGDPHHGAGGFGASTAQFALAYRFYALEASFDPSAIGARKLYRELMVDEPLKPSGADLVAQWSGGVVLYEPSQAQVTSCWGALDWRDLLVFSAAGQKGRKVATHEHLQSLAARGFPSSADEALMVSLEKLTRQALGTKKETISGAPSGVGPADPAVFGRCLNDYADTLASAGLEAPAAHADRQALAKLPGVLGVKGAGALQADALVLLMESASPHRAAVIEAAHARGLKLVADGLVQEAGIASGQGGE